MRCIICALTGVTFYILSSVCVAYAPGTHQILADAAANNSVLVQQLPGIPTTVLQDLGLTTYTDTGETFKDTQSDLSIEPEPHVKPDLTFPDPGTVQALVKAGAAIEDDEFRSFCHFYDPVNVLPLEVVGFKASHTDPDWALGVDSSGSPISGACTMFGLGSQTQQYSLTNANSYFYNALTLPLQSDRYQNFGDLFLSVGHALHLLEDMGQPQHVRNDMHCDSYVCIPFLHYHPSKYEDYVFRNSTVSNSATYTPPDFVSGTLRSFWTNNAGSGLADYTNANFLSVGTMSYISGASVGYDLPVLDGYAYDEPVSQVILTDLGRQAISPEIMRYCSNQQNNCDITFYSSTVKDKYANTQVANLKAVSDSVFNEDLKSEGAHRVYTLNDATYQSAWNILSPVIIGYGAGMINHFFRGRLGVQPDPSNADSYIVSNLSGYELKGSVEFYYDDKYGNRTPIPSAVTSVDLAAYSSGQAPAYKSIPVVLPAYPQTQATGGFMAVFKGNIGTEPGIAGKYFTDGFYLLDDDYSSYGGLAQQYTTGGEFINELSLGVLEDYVIRMAASTGSLFATGYLPDGQNGAAVPVVVRDGNTIIPYPASTFVDELAVNDKYLFIAAEGGATSETIYMYDLNGNPVDLNGNPVTLTSSGLPPPVMTVPISFVVGMGVNDSVMCITGLDSNGNAADFLYSLTTGSEITTLNTTGLVGDTCAATSDRVYIARNLSNGGIDVDVYGNNGSLITTFSVDGETESLGIAATDKQIYVEIFDYNGAVTPGNSSGYEQGVAVYQRDPSTDSFNFVRKIWVSPDNGNVITRDIAVDVKAVIANGDH